MADKRITDKIIELLSSKISYRALKSMGVAELGLSQDAITNIEDENEKDIANRSRTILRKWRNKNPGKNRKVFATLFPQKKNLNDYPVLFY